MNCNNLDAYSLDDSGTILHGMLLVPENLHCFKHYISSERSPILASNRIREGREWGGGGQSHENLSCV